MRWYHLLLVLPVLLRKASSISLGELAQHDNPGSDCWIAYHDQVFDLSSYRHPRNLQSVISNGCGKDDTVAFSAVHPKSYLSMIGGHKVGDLTETEPTPPPTPKPTPRPTQLPTPRPTPYPTQLPTPGSAFSPTEQPTTPPTVKPTTQAPSPPPLSASTVSPTTIPPLTFSPTDPIVTTPAPTTAKPTTVTLTTLVPTTSPPATIAPTTMSPTQSPSTAATGRLISLTELALHDSPQDCWVLFYDMIYDMTIYAPMHPGPGSSVIYPVCGKNGTATYDAIHEKILLVIVEEWSVGDLWLQPETTIASLSLAPTEAPDTTKTPSMESGSSTEMPVSTTTPPAGGITFEELQLHSDPDDCWVVYYGKVYDMTEYAPKHPGPGASVIYDVCGQDGTEAYETAHTKELLVIVQDLMLGDFFTAISASPTPVPEGAITVSELQDHADPDNCWVSYFGDVFDMTFYSLEHPIPPGASVINAGCGRDDTTQYAVSHPRELLSLVEDAKVGFLLGAYYPEETSTASRGRILCGFSVVLLLCLV